VAWAAGITPEYLSSASFLQRRRAATALGRVVAHEIVHALLPQLPHAERGIMAERLRDSLDDPLGLDERTTEALLAATARAREAGLTTLARVGRAPLPDPPPLVGDVEAVSEGVP
jgi:hypothetical protein